MSLKMTMQENNYILPRGVYPAEITAVKKSQKQNRESVEIIFTISKESEYAGRKLRIFSPEKLNKKSKLFKIISKIVPGFTGLKVSDEIEKVIGKRVWVTTKPKNSNGGILYPKIVKMKLMSQPRIS
jgi:hypothetical protein